MKKMFVALVLALIAVPAFAGSITFQVVETGQTTATKTYSIPDAQIDRMVAAYQVAANASIGGAASRAQVLNFIANQLIQGIIVQYVLGIETQVADDAARASVTPINPQ